jgi:hypothetical protein
LENNANVRVTWILFTTLHCNLQLDLLDPHNSLNGYGPFVVITILSFPRSGLITGFAAIITRRVPHVEQELLTLPEHPRSSSVFSGVRVARSLVFCVKYCRLMFLLLPFFFWPLYCLCFFTFRFRITPLESSNSPYSRH